jgi:hypothetical protein
MALIAIANMDERSLQELEEYGWTDSLQTRKNWR